MAETQRQLNAWHRITSIAAITIITFVGFEALLYINNLYQPAQYIKLSIGIYLIMVFWLVFLFDLHYKNILTGHKGTFLQALRHRFHYVFNWEHFRHFQTYMILPGIIYWGTVILLGINFGHNTLLQFLAVCSSLALIMAFSMLKEIFHAKQSPIKNQHFLVLGYVKLYATWLIFSAALGIVWFYCFPPHIFYLVVYLSTFMLLYQALFQFSNVRFRNVVLVVLISLAVSIGSIFVYQYWNVNYFSAGLFLTAIYNLFWGLMFHHMNKTLSRNAILEQAAIFVLIVVMVFGVTNFHAKILRCF